MRHRARSILLSPKPRSASAKSVSTRQLTPALAQSIELSLGPLLSEISRTAVSYEQRVNQALGGMVFTGGGAALKGFKEFAQTKIQNEVRLADPFSKTQAPAFLEGILKEAGPEFTVAVGLALRRLQEVG